MTTAGCSSRRATTARPIARRASRCSRAIPAEELFARTGVLPQPINTVFRLGERLARLRLRDGTTALLMPDLWTFRLCGEHGAERTIAGTTGMLSAGTGDWDDELLGRAGIDPRVLPAVVEPGQRAGTLRPELRDRLGMRGRRARCCAPPATTPPRRSRPCPATGTSPTSRAARGRWPGWSTTAPVLDPAAMEAGFTNELGVGGRVRLPAQPHRAVAAGGGAARAGARPRRRRSPPPSARARWRRASTSATPSSSPPATCSPASPTPAAATTRRCRRRWASSRAASSRASPPPTARRSRAASS